MALSGSIGGKAHNGRAVQQRLLELHAKLE
jgi:hypothetical protein